MEDFVGKSYGIMDFKLSFFFLVQKILERNDIFNIFLLLWEVINVFKFLEQFILDKSI